MMTKLLQIKIFLCVILFTLSVSCNRNDEEKTNLPIENIVKMKYKNLGDVQLNFLKSFSCDVDDDGKKDFYIISELIGKPSEESDYHSYFFASSFYTFCPIDPNEQTPLLNPGDTIGKDIFPNHEWYNVAETILAEKVIRMSGDTFWKGKWKDASHKYLAFAIEKNGNRYYGWLELSFSQTSEAVILHSAAIAEKPDKNIFAGK